MASAGGHRMSLVVKAPGCTARGTYPKTASVDRSNRPARACHDRRICGWRKGEEEAQDLLAEDLEGGKGMVGALHHARQVLEGVL